MGAQWCGKRAAKQWAACAGSGVCLLLLVHAYFARCAARFGEMLGGMGGGMLGEKFGGWCGEPRGKISRGALSELLARQRAM